MDLKIVKKNNTLFVSLNGDIDHHNSEIIKDKVDEGIIKYHCKNLIFDMSTVDFMDSSGIGVFIGRYKTISKRGGQVCITNIDAQLDRILEVSGLYRILKVYDTVKEAIEGIRGKSE